MVELSQQIFSKHAKKYCFNKNIFSIVLTSKITTLKENFIVFTSTRPETLMSIDFMLIYLKKTIGNLKNYRAKEKNHLFKMSR